MQDRHAQVSVATLTTTAAAIGVGWQTRHAKAHGGAIAVLSSPMHRPQHLHLCLSRLPHQHQQRRPCQHLQ